MQPTATLGSTYASLEEFVLGVIEQADPQFTCAITSSVAVTGALQARGVFAAAGVSTSRWTESYLVFRLPLRRPAEWAKPVESAGVDLGSPLAQGLRVLARLSENSFGCFDAVTGAQAAFSNGTTVFTATRSSDASGEYHQQAGTNKGHYSFYNDRHVKAASGGIFSAAVAVNLTGSSNSRIFSQMSSITGNIPPPAGAWCFSGRDGGTQVNCGIETAGGAQGIDVTVPSGFAVVAMTYDGATLKAYLNGFLYSTLSVNSALASSTDPVSICGNDSADQSYPGRIYSAWLWDRVLSDAEMLMLWQRPYSGLAPVVRRYAVINPATFNYTGNFTAAGHGTAAWTGSRIFGASFTARGVGNAGWSGSIRHGSGAFACAARGLSSWTSFTQRLGAFSVHGVGSGSWSGKVSFGSIAFTVLGVGSASWVSKASLTGVFNVHGVGAVRWQAAGVILGSFSVEGVGTASFLVGLDGVIYTCLTKGDKPTVVVHFPNFVY